MNRYAVTLAATLGAVLMSLFGFLSPAFGHAELVSSSPKAGAKLDAPPASVSFKFDETLLTAGNAITATDTETGARLKLGAVKTSGRKLSVTWPKSAPAGQYRVAYRAVSADGHPITGRIVFTYSKPSAIAVVEPAPTSGADSVATALGPTPLSYPVNSVALMWVVLGGLAGLVIAGLTAISTSRRTSR